MFLIYKVLISISTITLILPHKFHFHSISWHAFYIFLPLSFWHATCILFPFTTLLLTYRTLSISFYHTAPDRPHAFYILVPHRFWHTTCLLYPFTVLPHCSWHSTCLLHPFTTLILTYHMPSISVYHTAPDIPHAFYILVPHWSWHSTCLLYPFTTLILTYHMPSISLYHTTPDMPLVFYILLPLRHCLYSYSACNLILKLNTVKLALSDLSSINDSTKITY